MGHATSHSRSALGQFIGCPRRFNRQRRVELAPPARAPLTPAVAADALLKNEIVAVRSTGVSHPFWERYGLSVGAFRHPDIDLWSRSTAHNNSPIFGCAMGRRNKKRSPKMIRDNCCSLRLRSPPNQTALVKGR